MHSKKSVELLDIFLCPNHRILKKYKQFPFEGKWHSCALENLRIMFLQLIIRNMTGTIDKIKKVSILAWPKWKGMLFWKLFSLFFNQCSEYQNFCIIYKVFHIFPPLHFRDAFRVWLLELQVLTDILVAGVLKQIWDIGTESPVTDFQHLQLRSNHIIWVWHCFFHCL